MALDEVPLALILLGPIAYAVLAGADFGAGFWQLLGGGGERARAIREQNYSQTTKVFLQSRMRFWLAAGFSGSVTTDLPIERLSPEPGTAVDARGAEHEVVERQIEQPFDLRHRPAPGDARRADLRRVDRHIAHD